MAYFNVELAAARGLHPIDPYLLQLIHQNKNQDTSEALILIMDDDGIKRLHSLGLMEMIKGTKQMNEFQKLRLSKKGSKWLKDFQMSSVVENDIKVFESLKVIYLEAEKEIGSEEKTKKLIAWFRTETGFNHRQIWLIAKKFVADEERMTYSYVLEKVFWTSTNHFQTTPKLEDSKLWLYYEKYKDWFDVEFKKLEK